MFPPQIAFNLSIGKVIQMTCVMDPNHEMEHRSSPQNTIVFEWYHKTSMFMN